METGEVGDRMIVESEQVGRPAREGEILEVLGSGETIHYVVRWEDGHKTTFFPSLGSSVIRKAASRAKPRGKG